METKNLEKEADGLYETDIETIGELFPDAVIKIATPAQARNAFLGENAFAGLGKFRFDKISFISVEGQDPIIAFAALNGFKNAWYIVPVDGSTPFLADPEEIKFIDMSAPVSA